MPYSHMSLYKYMVISVEYQLYFLENIEISRFRKHQMLFLASMFDGLGAKTYGRSTYMYLPVVLIKKMVLVTRHPSRLTRSFQFQAQ